MTFHVLDRKVHENRPRARNSKNVSEKEKKKREDNKLINEEAAESEDG